MKPLKLDLPDATDEVLISSNVNRELRDQVKRQVQKDQKAGRRVTMRAIIEAGFRAYLSGRTK